MRIFADNVQAFETNVNSAYLPTENAKTDENRKQAQITELNAFNAIMAVIRFKQHFLLFDRLGDATSYIFDTAMLEVDSKRRSE